MCGRFTNKLTWAEIVALYRFALPAPPHNMPPLYNICPTDPVDGVTEHDGKRDFAQMRWGLVPKPQRLKGIRWGHGATCRVGPAASPIASRPYRPMASARAYPNRCRALVLYGVLRAFRLGWALKAPCCRQPLRA